MKIYKIIRTVALTTALALSGFARWVTPVVAMVVLMVVLVVLVTPKIRQI